MKLNQGKLSFGVLVPAGVFLVAAIIEIASIGAPRKLTAARFVPSCTALEAEATRAEASVNRTYSAGRSVHRIQLKKAVAARKSFERLCSIPVCGYLPVACPIGQEVMCIQQVLKHDYNSFSEMKAAGATFANLGVCEEDPSTVPV